MPCGVLDEILGQKRGFGGKTEDVVTKSAIYLKVWQLHLFLPFDKCALVL